MNYRTMSNGDIKLCKKSVKTNAETSKRFGLKNIQADRFKRDSISGNLVGVSKMNLELHGPDGEYENGVPFENKNITSFAKSTTSYGFKLQDTTSETLDIIKSKSNMIALNSFWSNSDEPDFCLLGNTKFIADLLQKSYNPNTRKSCNASFLKCLDRGFKIVAVSYDKEDTINAITKVFPSLGKKLTFSDIYTKKDMIALAESMM